MSRQTLLIERLGQASEVIILAMACLSPWAIGAVDAWAQWILYGGLVLVMILGLLTGERSGWKRRLFSVPSMALAGLALLALLQAIPLPDGVVKAIAPSTHAWRAGLAPDVPQRVRGDTGPPVSPPATTLSQDPDASLRTATQLAASWLLFQAVLALGGGYGSLRRFGMVTVVNAVLLTLFAITQALTWNGKIYGIRPSLMTNPWLTGGPFVLHNHLAAYLNIGFGLALGLLLGTLQGFSQARGERATRSVRRSRSLWAGYAAGLIFAGILASHSRGGFLAMMISTAVTILILRPSSIRLGAGLGVMVVVTALFLIATGSASPFERLATLADPTQESYAGRIQAWGVSLRAWRTFPLWGTGLGSFPAATSAFYRQQFGNTYFSHAENEYLQVLTEGGIVGLGLGLLALATIGRLGRRALVAAPTPRDRALVLGALAGGLALMVQCLSDFPLHIPGVAVSAVVLAALLSRLGMDAGAQEPVAGPKRARVGPILAGLAMVGLSIVLVVQGTRLARAEFLVRGAGLPFPGSLMPSVDVTHPGDAELKQTRAALQEALRLRPDWAEGHLRLGSALLGLYSNLAAEWLGKFQGEKNPAATAILSDPLWLHGVVHSASAADLAAIGGVLDHEPVHDYLIPAARSFLEARRCSPDLALSHARLASLDYLLDGGESTSVHAGRALRMTGYDHLVLALAGHTAAQAGDLDLAARCWRKSLLIHESSWKEIAVTASLMMTPDQILQKVLPPGGRYPLRIADLLYAGPESREARDRFLKAGLDRLQDDDISPTGRTWLEAQIRARLDERDRARKLMLEALAAEPMHPEWRVELIDWLILWGDVEEASRQARIGLTLHPDHPEIRRALQAALDAYAKGPSATPSRN